jgi:hypothetical protein
VRGEPVDGDRKYFELQNPKFFCTSVTPNTRNNFCSSIHGDRVHVVFSLPSTFQARGQGA